MARVFFFFTEIYLRNGLKPEVVFETPRCARVVIIPQNRGGIIRHGNGLCVRVCVQKGQLFRGAIVFRAVFERLTREVLNQLLLGPPPHVIIALMRRVLLTHGEEYAKRRPRIFKRKIFAGIE